MTFSQFHPFVRHARFEGRVASDALNSTAAQDRACWTPRVDVREEDQRFVILADVPGVDLKDVEINMDKSVLTIKGDRKTVAADDSAKASRIERRFGAFERSFVLPDSADAENITASGKLGVLEIAIPKKAQATPRRIEIVH